LSYDGAQQWLALPSREDLTYEQNLPKAKKSQILEQNAHLKKEAAKKERT